MKRSVGNSALWTSSFVGLVVLGWPGIGHAAEPARQWVVYLLPHSHVDIGYTHVQTEVERKHWGYYEQAIEASRRTADYPAGARFKWNVEVLWAVDSYLKQASPQKQQEFVEAVQKGWIELDALYGNELTGLCRPEELLRLCDYARRISRRCGVKIDSAMITDVAGYTWGLTSVFGDCGVKYMSIAPNMRDRIGYTLVAWADKPFYWISPDGKHKVLCWTPAAYGDIFNATNMEKRLPALLRRLEAKGYPYDLVQTRFCVGDNAGPAVELSDLVKNWNATHDSPRLVIATTSEMMREFERRYADKIPQARGDFTPYWEDGAGSSARETAANRDSAERLVQAETLFAMLRPTKYPAERFYDGWRNVMLYSEHTWGAHTAITNPDLPFTRNQWRIKQGFALDGDRQSRILLDDSLDGRGRPVASAVDVFNTSCWPRTDLVTLTKEMSSTGDVLKDPSGQIVPSQRLSTGELAFLAKDVPPLAGRRYTIVAGSAPTTGSARAEDTTLSAGALTVKIDPTTGAIASFRAGEEELVESTAGIGLNGYVYLPGGNVKDAEPNGPVQVRVMERGPLVAALEIAADAPGCNRLVRQVRVIDGLDRVEIVNIVDKKAIRAKEGVHFGFGFRVPEGVMRMDIPWAVIRPETDQIPGACKNWFTVQRFVDISNDRSGVTWATLDAPLVEVGGLTANLPGIQQTPGHFLAHIGPSQTIYSWVMNNHWHTNYKADQEGPTTFRYAIRPHGPYDGGAAQRFGIESSQPLVATAAQGRTLKVETLFSVEPAGVMVTSVQPLEDGKALAVRLFNATGSAVKATVRRHGVQTVDMAPWEIVTLRVSENP
jgi:alpha-mannosidase